MQNRRQTTSKSTVPDSEELPFLEKLNSKMPLKEGIEGHRRILQIIYRSGHISLFDLSYQTLIPLPVLSSVVNFLIEKEILDRIPEGILYTDKGMQYIEQELKFYGYGIAQCDQCNQHPIYLTPRWDEVVDQLADYFDQRPTVDTTIDQAYGTPETSLQRALYLYANGALEGKKICLLGDDDYTSIAIGLLYLGFFPEEPKLIPDELWVIDIDSRILNGIKLIFQNLKLSLNSKTWDYRQPIPSELLHHFQTVMVDPPYSEQGLKLTLSRAIGILESRPGCEIYLSFAHRPPEELFILQKIIIQMGLVIQEMYPRFNQYEGAQILGNTTQIMRLITTKETHPIIEPNIEFTEKIYTGEINPSIRHYYCSSCKKAISVGTGCEFTTIEVLKEKGCPYCKKNEIFSLEGKLIKKENVE